MKTALFFRSALVASVVGLPLSTSAAPLDALLTANQPRIPGQVRVEAAADLVNDTVDVFNVRGSSGLGGSDIGNYRGSHLRGGLALTPDIWIDGAIWRRTLEYRADQARINTWQAAAQYRVLDGATYGGPSVAMRLGAWGNYADQLSKTSISTVQGVTLNTLKVENPKDIQYQLDTIATWQRNPGTEVSLFAGGGISRVRVGSISATGTRGGCNYNLSFGANSVSGTLAQFCNASTVADRFTLPYSDYGVDPYQEVEYRAKFIQAGLSAMWTSGDWQLRGGYQYIRTRRDDVDAIIRQRGGQAQEANHVLVGEVMYRVVKNVSLFARGQYMQHQFTGEIPFAYNTMTAQRFNQKYGIVSAGLVVEF